MKRSCLFPIVASAALCAAPGVHAESDAPRVWKDTTGKFQIRATLVEQTASAVRLHTSDGREISVPIERLSPADRDYLKSLEMPKDNPFAGGTPIAKPADGAPPAGGAPRTLRDAAESKSVGDEMALPGTGATLDLSSDSPDGSFVPDPQTKAPLLPAGLVPVSPIDAYDNVAGPVVANAAGGLFLVSIGRNKSGSPQETRGRIYTVNLERKTSDLVWDHPNAVRVLDHDAPTGRTLIVDKLDQFQRGGELVMVVGLETGNAKPLYRRTLPGAGKPGFAPQVAWARLLSGSHVAAIVDRVLHVWDLPAARLVYRIENASESEPPVFSGNLIYMAVPQSGKVVLVETASGTIRKSIPTGNTLTPGAAFHSEGRLLAICFSNQYRVWDCVADNVVSEATVTDHLGSHPIHWIAPRLFRGALGDAVHLDLGMSVWKYATSASTAPIVVGNKLLTATTSQNCAVASVPIPHASAEKSIERLMQAGDAAMLVRPGASVAIAVEGANPADQAAITASLSEAAEKAGWKVSSRGSITLVAKIGRGKPEELHFRSMGGDFRATSTANLTPFTAELEIRRGTSVLWSRSTVNRIPPLLHLQEGETVQDAVKRFEKPDPAFFSRLNLPPRIPKPEVSSQVGQSVLTEGKWRDLNTGGRR
ncbi:MAG: hypothetical protein HUU20_04175 [Pirellulales bacterium]|nr:hypothetical protein [Pirellulales bacterium]